MLGAGRMCVKVVKERNIHKNRFEKKEKGVKIEIK